MTNRSFSFPRVRWLASAALVAAVLTACGGDTTPSAEESMASFTQQKLEWRACDEHFVGEEHWNDAKDYFADLGERAQCAMMRAPLDYANPALGELQVALSKVAAGEPQQRQGAILFNPGGPGGDGLTLGAHFWRRLRQVDPGRPVSQLLKQMSDRYDLVGFSPRGTGSSTALDCGASEYAQMETLSSSDRSPQTLKDQQELVRLYAQACIDHPLSKHINTDATARDMDLVRVLLRDEKLNYIGYSYGTWLGVWYAGLFPERVGRMLLDSNTNFIDSFDAISALQPMGHQRVLDEVLLPYATRHPQIFNLGESVSELRRALLALSPALKELLFSAEDKEGNSLAIQWALATAIDENIMHLSAALGLQDLLARQPAAGKDQMDAAITAHRFAPNPVVNAYTIGFARKLAAKMFEGPYPVSKKRQLETAVNIAIRCNDTGTSGDAQHWIDISNASAARYPFTGGSEAVNFCLHWPKPAKGPLPWAMAAKAGPLLMLQSRFDALTPVEGAQVAHNALPNASMILVEDEFTHAIFPYGTDCVDGPVAHYFLHGTMPQRLSTCAGKPLSFDADLDVDGDGDGDDDDDDLDT